jgi:hypothetical protein
MQTEQKSVALRVFSLLLALYLLNFSIDSRDAKPDQIPEDLSFNDIESIYEFVLETVLGLENAVAEQDEHDQDDNGSLDFKKIYLNPYPTVSTLADLRTLRVTYFPVDSQRSLALFYEIDAPPPKV